MDTLIKTTELDTFTPNQGVVMAAAHNGIFGGCYSYNSQDLISTYGTASESSSVVSKDQSKTLLVEVTVDCSGEVVRETETKSVIITEGATALTATQVAFGAENIESQSHGETLGEFITSINGVEPSNGRFWLLKINGNIANFGPSTYILQDEDKLRYEIIGLNPLLKQ